MELMKETCLALFRSKFSPGFLIPVVFALCAASFSSHAADVFPVSRRGGLVNTLWTSAGVTGGRPTVTTINATFSPGITLSQLNAAIAACPSNQVIKLNPGTYNFSGGMINLTRNGVVLRGATNSAGQPTTHLVNVVLQMSPFWFPSGPSGGWPQKTTRSVTGGLTEGSTSITLSSTPNSDFVVGDVFLLDQTDDGVLVKTDTQSDSYLRSGRSYCQALQITGISGNTVSFRPPLLGSYWSTGRSPEAVAWSSVLGRSAVKIGLEDMDIIKGSGNAIYTIRMGPAVDCWVRNVVVDVNTSASIRMSFAVNCEIVHSTFHDTSGTGSGTYATLPAVVTSCKVEDNIFTNLSLAMPCISAVGSSFSYNYGVGPYPYTQQSWFAEYMFPHGGHTHHTIWEGNWLDGPIYFDVVFGNNNSDNGIVRNRIKGWAPTKTANCQPITLENDMDNTTIIGNLLGENSFHSTYSQMYDIHTSCAGTLIKHNYNTVNDGVNAAEALGADTVRDSYCYNSRPDWFGDRPWPPFNPSTFAQAAATSIPAGYRSIMGSDPPVAGSPSVSATASPMQGLSAPLTVNFSSAGTFDPEASPLTYSWAFGDGATSTQPNPSHAYTSEGTFMAQLTVSDGENATVSEPLYILVGNQSPVAAASANPLDGQPPLAVTFSSTGSLDPEGENLSYFWEFGDGTTSTAANPSHTYLDYGSYVARLTVSDGTIDVTSQDIVISVNNGLVAAYSFEEASGSTTEDLSGHDNTGTLVSNPVRTDAGRFGRALLFNGSSSYVNVPHSESLNLTKTVTLMAWCNPTVVTDSYRNLVYKPEDIYFLEGFTPVPNTPRFYGTFSSANLNATTRLQANQWTHVAGTYDGATMRLYINGVQVASRSQTGPVLTSTYDLGIGGNSLNGQFFPGMIDEVRIYSRALSAAEIQSDMNSPIEGEPTPPKNVQVSLQ